MLLRMIVLCLLGFVIFGHSAEADTPRRRVALVIGNSSYTNTTPLPNAKTDAMAVAYELQKLKFNVDVALDTNASALQAAIQKFKEEVRKGDVAVALLYYAGHGIQFSGKNLLLPTDISLTNNSIVNRPTATVALEDLIDDLQSLGADLTLAFVDACRNDLPPAPQRTVGGSTALSADRGLMRPPSKKSDFVIAYSTFPGATASDGRGHHSPFTESLLKHMAKPDLPIDGLLDQITHDVGMATGASQRPWISKSTRMAYSLNPTATAAVRPSPEDAMLKCGQMYFRATVADDKLKAYEEFLSVCATHPRAAEIERSFFLEIERRECNRLLDDKDIKVADLQMYLRKMTNNGGLCGAEVKLLLDRKAKMAVATPPPPPETRSPITPPANERPLPPPVIYESAPTTPNSWIERRNGRWVEGDGDLDVLRGYSYTQCAESCANRSDCAFLEHYKPEQKCSLFRSVRSTEAGKDADVGVKRSGAPAVPAAVSPPPRSAFIERRPYGEWVEGDGYEVWTGSNYSDCEQRCLADSRCAMMEFHRPERKCNLYRERRAIKSGGSSDVGIRR